MVGDGGSSAPVHCSFNRDTILLRVFRAQETLRPYLWGLDHARARGRRAYRRVAVGGCAGRERHCCRRLCNDRRRRSDNDVEAGRQRFLPRMRMARLGCVRFGSIVAISQGGSEYPLSNPNRTFSSGLTNGRFWPKAAVRPNSAE